MKKFLKRAAIAVVALIVIFVVVGLFLPTEYKVTRSADIKASKAEVFNVLNDLKTWEQWSAWTKEKYPNITYTYSDQTVGKGGKYSWSDETPGFTDMFSDNPPAGNGSMEILNADLDKGIIVFETNFEGNDPIKGTFTLTEKDGVTSVEWKAEGNMAMPVVGGYFVLMMDSMMGGEFQKGLDGLKDRLENKGAGDA